jgi:hypothetical protein
MSALLAYRNFLLRPWRSVFLLLGYSLGVAVMIVLLSIGEALLSQARDERLVGGGDVTVLPQGIDIEVMKTGGLGGMFFSIDQSRFVYRQMLAAARWRSDIETVAPQIEGKLLYFTRLTPGAGREIPIMATGEIPSLTRRVGAMPPMAAGQWTDDDFDRRWHAPAPDELRHEIDHFHMPAGRARNDPGWAEWHYFNVLSPDRMRWTFVSFIIGGEVPDGEWGGQVLVTTHEQGKGARRYSALVPPRRVRFSMTSADLDLGESTVRVRRDGRYAVHAVAAAEASGARIVVDLVVSPAPGVYIPGGEPANDEIVSGYVVPALRADATGSICVESRCQSLASVQAYHDHNWGVWNRVTWEWGASRAGPYTLLYGRVHAEDTSAVQPPLFVFLADSLGFLGLFRPKTIEYSGERQVRVGGATVLVPARGSMFDIRGDDTVRIDLEIEDAAATDTRRATTGPGDPLAARGLRRPYFVQMKGVARLSGRVNGVPIAGSGSGFFETYR